MPGTMRRKDRKTGEFVGKWLIRWKDEFGAWTNWTPTTAQDEKAARKKAQQEEWECEEIRAGRRQRAVAAIKLEDEPTLAEICTGYLKERFPREDDRYIPEKQIAKHILDNAFGELRLSEVEKKVLTKHWAELSEDLEDGTLNRIRTTVLSAFTWAEENEPTWKGRANPILKFEPRPNPKKGRVTLRDDEVPIFLAHVPEAWLNFFATAFWTAFRKGELCGLRKTDVNLRDRLITVARSYDKEKTKSGDAATIPIAEPLVPFLESAIASSRSVWMFPDAKGRMRTKECNPEKILRTVLKRAGMVTGYYYVCRRCKGQEMKRRREAEGEKHKEMERQRRAKGEPEPASYFHTDAKNRDCPDCKMKLWPRAVPYEMNFHSVRHTVITLLLKANVGMEKVQRIARHANITTTVDMYGHLHAEDLRSAIQALPTLNRGFGGLVEELGKAPHPTRTTGGKFVKDGRGLNDGPYRVRTCDPYRVKKDEVVNRGTQPSTSTRKHSISKSGAAQELQPLTPNIAVFGGLVEERLRAVPVRAQPGLLGIKEVAQTLGLSTATVYAICERGELACVRVASNAIRITPADLSAYIERRKGAPK